MHWRLLDFTFADAATNMAVDEAALLAHEKGLVPPTLRLYGWRPPAVSVGYFQPVEGQINVDACRKRGLGLVRRPTGGRAILHDDEVTYSVVIRRDLLPCRDGVMASYRYVSGGIERGLNRLGVPASLADGRPEAAESPGRRSQAACFAKAARCDIALGGRKIVGSAQVRTAKAILQHGSVPLTFDPGRLFAVLHPDDRHRTARFAAVSVSDALGRRTTLEEVCGALVEGFSSALGIELDPGRLTPEERDDAARLVRDKYGTLEWNLQTGALGAAVA